MKKVILPDIGVSYDGTCGYIVGLLWYYFKAHSYPDDKEYCIFFSCLYLLVLGGQLAPAGQPLEKVINKMFRVRFRDLYDDYIITSPIGNNGAPKSPTIQLLTT